MTSDIPFFIGTEDAERYGRGLRRVLAPDEFQTLVRTYFVSELAAREAINPQNKANLAFRCQTLREAVQAFLFDGRVKTPAPTLSLSHTPSLSRAAEPESASESVSVSAGVLEGAPVAPELESVGGS